ncbi:MAG: hypothetical protein Q9182_005194, partial [Xanthomendoza sp. 2 TL-2023]
GCCHSTPQPRPDSPTTFQAAHPSRPIHRTTSTTASPRTSSHTPTLTQPPSTSRRHLPAHEHFNAPLRPHKPSPTTTTTTTTSSSSSRPTRPPKTWTPSTLRKERAEFFETRVTGQAEIWGSLRLVCEALWEGDVATAQGIVDAVGVTVPTGDLVEGAFDERGGLYVLPGWVVGEPEGLVPEEVEEEGGEERGGVFGDEDGREEKGKEVLDTGVVAGGTVRVRARLSDRGGPDVVVLVGQDERVGTLGRRVAEEAKVKPSPLLFLASGSFFFSPPPRPHWKKPMFPFGSTKEKCADVGGNITQLPIQARITIMYLGKILRENQSLRAQGWREGHVINALVFQ